MGELSDRDVFRWGCLQMGELSDRGVFRWGCLQMGELSDRVSSDGGAFR